MKFRRTLQGLAVRKWLRSSWATNSARAACLVAAGLLILISSGCAGYKLGPSNGVAAGEKTIQVVPFVNQTLEPRLTDATTSQLRKQLQQDGTFQLISTDDANIVVTGVLTKYQRFGLSFATNNTLTVQDYRLILTAQITARERASGRVVLDQPVTGNTIMRVGSDLVSAERQVMPILAADLARHVTALLVEGGW